MLSEPATTIGTQGRGVYTLKNQIARLVDHIGFRTGIATPKHIDQMLPMGCQCLNGGIRKLLPTKGTMTIGLMGTDSERCIQQEYTLFCPSRQIT